VKDQRTPRTIQKEEKEPKQKILDKSPEAIGREVEVNFQTKEGAAGKKDTC